jgi:hypothetical protein
MRPHEVADLHLGEHRDALVPAWYLVALAGRNTVYSA